MQPARLAAGRPHEVLPLVGVTHMTPQEVVAENLLLHQLDFLERSLAIGDDTAPVAIPAAVAGDDPLAAIYRGVAVTANANDERLAALDLLALVVAADSRLDAAEISTLTAISLDWQIEGFTERTFDEYLADALARAQAAIAAGDVQALVDDVDARLNSRVLRAALFSAARDLAGADDEVGAEEGTILNAIAVRFG